jgi:hypothetical protein
VCAQRDHPPAKLSVRRHHGDRPSSFDCHICNDPDDFVVRRAWSMHHLDAFVDSGFRTDAGRALDDQDDVFTLAQAAA